MVNDASTKDDNQIDGWKLDMLNNDGYDCSKMITASHFNAT